MGFPRSFLHGVSFKGLKNLYYSLHDNFNFRQNTSLTIGGKIYIGGRAFHDNSFLGFITDLNAWNRPLTDQEVEQFIDTCSKSFITNSKPNIISWPSINNSSIGENVHFETMPESATLCPQSWGSGQVSTRIMNYLLPFNISRSQCAYLGGKMPLITTEAEFLAISSKNFSSQIPAECEGYFWLPIVKSNSKKKTWFDARLETQSETEVDFLKWAPGQPNGNKISCLFLYQKKNKNYIIFYR